MEIKSDSMAMKVINQDVYKSDKFDGTNYIEKLLLKFKHLQIKEATTPYEPNETMLNNSGRSIAQLEYSSVIGSFIYAMHCTSPDIALVVHTLSRYTSNPGIAHWKATLHTFR